VLLDAYAISGIELEQIEFISALDHLSHTHVYGVTFERATSVAYRDRKHVLISGTASINHEGQILHEGDVSRQLDRTLENVEALLNQADATLADLCHFIVYVRDHIDCEMAERRMRAEFPTAPCQVVVAPVCRPGWLIEVEGMAIISADNPHLPEF
jgi:enamine deaminase RidA (YjgF/YER057c/UK114 family)